MATSDCPQCKAAAARLSHEFRSGCRGCAARAAARSPQFHSARRTGVVDRHYRALLEQFGLTHDEVKAAAAADRMQP